MTQKQDPDFRELLEQNYQWPDYYMFKFIAKKETMDQVIALLDGYEVVFKHSEKGHYVSITFRKMIHKTDEIFEMYEQVGKIPGVMSL